MWKTNSNTKLLNQGFPLSEQKQLTSSPDEWCDHPVATDGCEKLAVADSLW